ncbi:DMT family transporter [Erythrobacter sp. HKB08]|uniref:DMT family transporter n=1 Tax=Erythrobacter sp. HKB08 TaxID=2502843 RepID=UPI001008E949|nr:DMT family transporter [Erythrobacter sp. HKB08]
MQDNERQGVALALAGFACLAFGDAVIKTMAGEWSPIAVAALRFTIGLSGLATILALREGRRGFVPRNPWLQAGRGLCLAAATTCFFSAIFVMPLAEATSLIFLSPIIVALLSGPLLGEKVRRVTFAASAIAFVGVLVVLRPNLADVGIVALLPVAAALFISLMVIANRASAGQGSSLSMQVFIAAGATPILIVAAIAGHFSGIEALRIGVPDWTVVARCAFVAVTASSAHWLVYLGTTRAGAATVAPMTYVQLLVAVGLGWWWFGDAPDLVSLAGAAIIVSAGLLLWRSGRAVKAPVSD